MAPAHRVGATGASTFPVVSLELRLPAYPRINSKCIPEIEAQELQTARRPSPGQSAELVKHDPGSMSPDKNQAFGLSRIKNLSLKDGIKRIKR